MAKKTTTLKSFEEVDQSLLRLGQVEAFVQKREAEMNEKIQLLRDGFDRTTSAPRTETKLLQDEIEAFCILHKDEFEKSRSKDLVHGSVSFRVGNPSVAALNRKYSFKTIIELLKRLGLAKLYLRTKEEIDKEAILADYAAKKISDDKLAAAGIKVDQKESFNIDIAWDSIHD
jgi:phage host-nuclease inhibitor protein Gam